jgi:hypothetical protein
MKLRIDIRPYFPKIADYYWDELEDQDPHMTIWEWLRRDYDVVKIGTLGDNPELWVSFPTEQDITAFVLRWS